MKNKRLNLLVVMTFCQLLMTSGCDFNFDTSEDKSVDSLIQDVQELDNDIVTESIELTPLILDELNGTDI